MSTTDYNPVDRESFLRGLETVRENIFKAATAVGRDPSEVKICAVTKTFGFEAACLAAEAGLTDIGENRVQEAADKYSADRCGLALHLIGHLQTNKAAKAAGLFDRVDSVDSLRLAALLDKAAAEQGRILPIMAEINVGDDPNKSGVALCEASELCAGLAAFPALKLDGLMTILPLGCSDDEKMRLFTKFYEKSLDIAAEISHNQSMQLSMGMSDDYIQAVRCGATVIRVGSALFGQRQHR